MFAGRREPDWERHFESDDPVLKSARDITLPVRNSFEGKSNETLQSHFLSG